MIKEQLMNVRYKVIADYPKSIHKVGTVYDCGGSSEDMLYADTDGPRMRAYPHLFKKLEWWEERDEKDMPEYIQINYQYHKVKKWEKNSLDEWWPLNDENVNMEWHFFKNKSKPATREEYEKYLQSKK